MANQQRWTYSITGRDLHISPTYDTQKQAEQAAAEYTPMLCGPGVIAHAVPVEERRTPLGGNEGCAICTLSFGGRPCPYHDSKPGGRERGDAMLNRAMEHVINGDVPPAK